RRSFRRPRCPPFRSFPKHRPPPFRRRRPIVKSLQSHPSPRSHPPRSLETRRHRKSHWKKSKRPREGGRSLRAMRLIAGGWICASLVLSLGKTPRFGPRLGPIASAPRCARSVRQEDLVRRSASLHPPVDPRSSEMPRRRKHNVEETTRQNERRRKLQ